MVRLSLGFFAATTVLALDGFNIAPFARPCCSEDQHVLATTFDYRHPAGLARRKAGGWVWGLQWAEERDVAEVRIRFSPAQPVPQPQLQYWFHHWPPTPPRGHTAEDRVDDPWQGRWLTADTRVIHEGSLCRIRFQPLAASENPNAANLPGVLYRRTLKLRLLFPDGPAPSVESVEVLSPSRLRRFLLRLRVPGGKPDLQAYNGWVRSVERAGADWLVTVDGADPQPPGSNDVTVVKVRSDLGKFAFAPAEAHQGPMLLPDFKACIWRASDAAPQDCASLRRGARIRERLRQEPEQSYERAAREIPPLDPVERSGGRLMLVLAPEASWQKFAVEWGGHVLISKRGVRAFGKQLRLLPWPGDAISWRIGTGQMPSFREAAQDSTLAQLEDFLPVAVARWTQGGFHFQEQAFATLLSGPLSPEDPARNEHTPAVLMLRLTARNRTQTAQDAHLWLAMRPGEPLAFDGSLLTAEGGRDTRAHVRLPVGAEARLERCRDGNQEVPALHVRVAVAPGATTSLDLAIPFIPGLSAEQRRQLAALDYEAQYRRVVSYWRGLAENKVPFRVPEPRFNSFAQGLLVRIRLSGFKDPASGLYLLPAASYRYLVFANEASFQYQLLDVMGHHDLAARYLAAHIALQGSKPLVGSFVGDQKAVYYGARVDDEYDYTGMPYNLHHGTLLLGLVEHYFITRDRAWLARVAPSMKRAADWILEQRALTRQMLPSGERCPEYGLLPAGHLEDNDDWGHWFSVNAYAAAGLRGLAAALRETGDPDAARYHREAQVYLEDLRTAVRRAVEEAPVVRLRDNSWVPWVPTRVHQRIRLFGPLRTAYYARQGVTHRFTPRLSATRELLYGPLILFETGIFSAKERMAEWVLDDWEDNATMSEPLGLHVHGWVDEEYWFSRGGMVFQPNLQNPVRTYLRRGEIKAAIRSLYNNFVSCYYPSVNVFTEEYRQWRNPSGPFFKTPDEAKFVHRLRDLLLTEVDSDLWLAAGVPERWLEPGKQIQVREAPTHYGPVTYSLEALPSEVRASVILPGRTPFADAWLYVRLPQGRSLGTVLVDGRLWREVDPQARRIRLPRTTGRPIHIVIRAAEGPAPAKAPNTGSR